MDRTRSNKLLILSLVLIVFSLLLLSIPVRKRGPVPGPDIEPAQISGEVYVSEVIDGDTFKTSDGRTVRLIGVDTPEMDMPYYDEAVVFAESLLAGKRVSLDFDKEKSDKYGRLLAYVLLDSNSANEMMIKRGMGTVYLFDPNLKMAGDLIKAQKEARAADLGIWSLPDPSPEDFYVNIDGSFRFHRPLCMAIKNSDPRKREIYYSRDDLLDRGFSPCRNCRP